MEFKYEGDGGIIGGLIVIGLWLAFFGAWITHLVVSIMAQAWLFMIVGALIFPVAVVHGWATWLGFDWLS